MSKTKLVPDESTRRLERTASTLRSSSDGIDRREFLHCMAWAGTGIIWSFSGGIRVSSVFGATAAKPRNGLQGRSLRIIQGNLRSLQSATRSEKRVPQNSVHPGACAWNFGPHSDGEAVSTAARLIFPRFQQPDGARIDQKDNGLGRQMYRFANPCAGCERIAFGGTVWALSEYGLVHGTGLRAAPSAATGK